MEQVQPLLSRARGQQGDVQPTRGWTDCRGEGAAGSQSAKTHQSCNQWSKQLCFQWPRHQVELASRITAVRHCLCHLFSQRSSSANCFCLCFFSKFINMIMKHGDKILAKDIMTQVRMDRALQTHSLSQRFAVGLIIPHTVLIIIPLSDPREHKEETGGEIP